MKTKKNGEKISIYMKKVKNKIFKFNKLVFYVNDMLILMKKYYDVEKCNNPLNFAIKMKYLNNFKFLLKMNVHRNFGIK